TPTTEIYTLSLHDALPICSLVLIYFAWPPPTLTTLGSLHVPLTLYSNDTNLSSGLSNILLTMSAPIPTAGLIANAPISDTLSPRVGNIRTRKFCVSLFKSTLPFMVTLADEPLM